MYDIYSSKTKKKRMIFFFNFFFYQVSQFHHRAKQAIKDKIEENETHVVVIIAGLSYKKW
jgi:hypothetical protein